MSERRPNRVQRRDLHTHGRAASNPYTGSGDRLNIGAVPMGAARGHLDGYYPAPTIRDGVIGASKLDATGAGDGSGFVYNGITSQYELATVCTGAGIIGRIPYRATTRILGDSPFNTDGATVGLGTGQVGGVFLFIQPSSSAGTLAKLSHVGNSGKCLDVLTSDTGVIGIDVTMNSAASAAAAINVQHDGIGTGVGISAAGDYGLRVTAQNVRPTTCAALFATTHTTGTGTTVEVTSVGTGKVLDVNRSNGAAAQAAVTILDSVATASAALEVIAWASSAGTIIATNGGAGATVGATNTGTGSALTATVNNAASGATALMATTNGLGSAASVSITNAASTASVLVATQLGNGRAGYFTRSKTGATADVVTVHATDTADAGRALRVRQDGTGKGVTIDTTIGNGVEVTTGSGYAGIFLSAGPGDGVPNQVFICNGAGSVALQASGRVVISDGYGVDSTSLHVTRTGLGGQAIMAVGGVRTDTVRITSGSPAEGKVLTATDTNGNATWGFAPAGADTPCLVSLYRGNQTTTGPGRTLTIIAARTQIPFDLTTTPLPAGYICNADWDTTTIWGAFTPTHNIDASGATSDGTTAITVHFDAVIPPLWTACEVVLYIDKNGVPEAIDRAYVPVSGAAAIRMHLSGTYHDYFTGTDAYTVWIGSNVGAQAAVTNWQVKAFTTFVHTDDCIDCQP